MTRTFKPGLTVAACLALAACAQTPPPAINDKVVTVNIPVATKCIDPAKVPAPVPATPINGDAKHDSSTMAKTILALRSWVDQTTALITPCTIDPPPPTPQPSTDP